MRCEGERKKACEAQSQIGCIPRTTHARSSTRSAPGGTVMPILPTMPGPNKIELLNVSARSDMTRRGISALSAWQHPLQRTSTPDGHEARPVCERRLVRHCCIVPVVIHGHQGAVPLQDVLHSLVLDERHKADHIEKEALCGPLGGLVVSLQRCHLQCQAHA